MMRIYWLALLVVAHLLPVDALARPRPGAEKPAAKTRAATLERLDPETGKATALLRLEGESLGRPAVVGETIYVASSGHTLYALDARTGAGRWQYASAALIDGLAATKAGVFAGAGSALLALDPVEGKVLWKHQSDSPVTDPAIVGDLVLVNTLQGPIALEQATGKVRWQLDIQWGYFVFSPLPGDRLCVWKPDEIYIVETERGKTLWQSAATQGVSAPGALPTAAVASEDVIFQLRGARDDAEDWSLLARDAAAGRTLWTTPLGKHSGVGARTMVHGKTAYCILDDHLSAIDIAQGKLRWETTIPRPEAGGPGPRADDKTVYVPELNAGISAIDASTGKTRWFNPAEPQDRADQMRLGGLCAGESGLYITRNARIQE